MISKQAVAKSIASFQGKGFVEVGEDPIDARARIVSYSSNGRKLLKTAVSVISEIDDGTELVLEMTVINPFALIWMFW